MQTCVSMKLGVVEEHPDAERGGLAKEERVADVVPLGTGTDVGEMPSPPNGSGNVCTASTGTANAMIAIVAQAPMAAARARTRFDGRR